MKKSNLMSIAFGMSALLCVSNLGFAQSQPSEDQKISDGLRAQASELRSMAIEEKNQDVSIQLFEAAEKLEKTANAPDPSERTKVGKALRATGIGLKRTGGALMRTTGQVSTAADLAVTLPIRFVYKFFRGAITGVDHREGRSVYESISLGSGAGMWPTLGIIMLGSTSPATVALGAFFLTTTADYISASTCDTLTSEEQRRNIEDEKNVLIEMQTNLSNGVDSNGNPIDTKSTARQIERSQEVLKADKILMRFCSNRSNMTGLAKKVSDVGEKGGAGLHNGIKKVFKKKSEKSAEATHAQ